MQITEQAPVVYTFKLTIAEALILKEMVHKELKEAKTIEVQQFCTTIYNYLPSIENLTKGN